MAQHGSLAIWALVACALGVCQAGCDGDGDCSACASQSDWKGSACSYCDSSGLCSASYLSPCDGDWHGPAVDDHECPSLAAQTFGGNNIATGKTCSLVGCSVYAPNVPQYAWMSAYAGQIYCADPGLGDSNQCRWCPCSGHGTCCAGGATDCTYNTDDLDPWGLNGSPCACDRGYSGAACEIDDAAAAAGQNSCLYARDGECDEPKACPSGTDSADCAPPCASFADFTAWSNTVNGACCSAPGASCASGLPANCPPGCETALLPMQAACSTFLGTIGMVDSVRAAAATCTGSGH